MHNDYIKENRDKNRAMNKRSRPLVHELLTLPCGKKFKDDKIVNSKIAYSQRTCSGCTKKIRTYCKCSPGIMRCHQCFFEHKCDE